MGLRSRPHACRTRRWRALGLVLGVCAATASPVGAQTITDRFAQKSSADTNGKKDRLLVDAAQIVYNRDKNTVSAEGNVQLYYQGKTLEADRVTYDRVSNRVYAEGNAKLTEADGSVVYSNKFDLTDDFKDGFIDSLKSDTKDKTHFTAARAERTGGETTVFEKGIYTACDACKDHPERPPLWQVRAARIIHKNEEHMVYYEDGWLELSGIPIAYLPYFSTPDGTVTRKSGFLIPGYVYKTHLGIGAEIPYFWAPAPNYDVTFTPEILSQQGFLGEVEFRHRLLSGSYTIRASGIFQADPGAFAAAPYGVGKKQEFRGDVETHGRFNLSDKWKFGWDIDVLSDKFYTQDYGIKNGGFSTNYYKEAISTIYLNGQGDRSYFDLRGYRIQGLSSYDFQQRQPLVGPVLDYNRTIDIAPSQSFGIGGQVEIDANFTRLSRDAADYQATGARVFDSAFGLYDVCQNYTRGVTSGHCIVRGIGGDYTRATANLDWKRKFIDPIGEVWTPFVFAHASGYDLQLNASGTFGVAGASGIPTVSNSYQTNFFGSSRDQAAGEILPGAGLEWRYPFLTSNSFATQVIEPIAQIITRPNEPLSNIKVNEDAQSLVFDDTNLFEWNRYSGYDRFEGGTRANVGAQYTVTFASGGYANILAGQSFQLAGRNSYATPDAANVGISSGLDRANSDYVGRVQVAPASWLNFTVKTRLDPDTLDMRRFDAIASTTLGPWSASAQYANYASQPAIGFGGRREGLSLNTRYNFLEHYYVGGGVVFDFNGTGPEINSVTNLKGLSISSVSASTGYTDECTTVGLTYASGFQLDSNGKLTLNQTVLLTLQLRTLGTVHLNQSINQLFTSSTDGL